MTETQARAALTAAGHTPWDATFGPPGQPRFVVFTSSASGHVLVGLDLAASLDARSAVLADYLAALAAAGLRAELRADGYIHLGGPR